MIVLVTGAMRTGTSLASRQLHRMGIPMGTVMRFPSPRENGQEDWEDVWFTDLMLNHMAELDDQDETDFRLDIKDYIESRLGPEVWGMKSPFALPYIEDIRTVCASLDQELRVVLTTRNIDEAYASLATQTRVRSIKALQDKLVTFLLYANTDLEIAIEDSWHDPDSVKQKLSALVRS